MTPKQKSRSVSLRGIFWIGFLTGILFNVNFMINNNINNINLPW